MVGSPRCHIEQGVSLGEAEEAIARLENEGKTVVLVSTDGHLTGLVAIADTVRPGAEEALQRLKQAGVRTVMLTGDNERSAGAIARRVGVDEYDAQLLPTDKVDVIRRLREKHGMVAMVGDGINDAPAMAVADVGIAMGAAGTDIAIEAGDVVLMSDDLGKIAFVRELSNRAVTTIRQNIVVSLLNVAFMVIMALLGYLGLVTGLLLNEASALFVIVNALRLLKWREHCRASDCRRDGRPSQDAMDEQRAVVAPPLATAEAALLLRGAHTPGVTANSRDRTRRRARAAAPASNRRRKVSLPIFPMAAAQGSCCSGADADSDVRFGQRHQRGEGTGWLELGSVPDRWDVVFLRGADGRETSEVPEGCEELQPEPYHQSDEAHLRPVGPINKGH